VPFSRRASWLVVTTGSALVAAAAARVAVNAAWRLAQGDDPPIDPESADTEWRDAVAWTVVTGVAIGLAQLVARRGVAAGWRRAVGSRPPQGGLI
jgi:hypothetical protein